MAFRRSNGTFAPGVSGNPSGRRHLDAADLEWPDRGRVDGWASALTGIGTHQSDKRTSHHFQRSVLDYYGILNIWSADDMAARAIESLPNECMREGYEITIGDEGNYEDLKEDIEERLAEIGIDHAIQHAMELERALGGAAILIGVNDSRQLDEKLDPMQVRSVDWLTVLEPLELRPDTYYNDPEAPKFGEVEYYRLTPYALMGPGNLQGSPVAPNTLIHESRLIVFKGIRTSRYRVTHDAIVPLWGDSILTRLIDVLRDFHVAWHAAGILATDFSTPVITIEGLKMMALNKPEAVHARMQAIELGRSVARAVMLDTKEEYTRQSTSLAGYPDLLNAISMRCASAVDMPLTLLMGQSPKGLGNEGDSDVRFYYDRTKGVQRRKVGPVIRFIAKMIMQTLRKRKIPKKWGIRFNPLWQLTDAERAEARLTQARADSMYIKMGAVSCDEIRRSRFVGEYSFETQVDESKKAPGIPYPPTANGPAPGSPTEPGGADGEPVKKGAKASPIPGVPPKAPGVKGSVAAAANRHGVTGYVRKNPVASPLGSAAKEGGDTTPRKDADGDGTYRDYAGIPVIIENQAGSVRSWIDSDGTPGQTIMTMDYGYIYGTRGADGDSVDVYLGPDPGAGWVYVIHQLTKADNFATYDEDKVLLGMSSADAAQAAYLKQYDDPRFFGGMSMMTIAAFRAKVARTGTSAISGKVTNDAVEAGEDVAPPVRERPAEFTGSSLEDVKTCPDCGDMIEDDKDHSCDPYNESPPGWLER